MEAPKLTRTHACAPATVRGRGVLLGAHADSQLITYASGHHVVLRHVRDEIPARFYEHQYACTVARVSPNGQWVASGDVSGRVRVWGLNEDMTLKAEHHPLSGAVDDIAWSEDGQRIVCCGQGKQSFTKVFLWDTGSAIGDVSGSTKRVNSCDFKPSRPFRVATASEDFAVSFYEGPPFKFVHTPHRHLNYANCVRFAPDGTKFASVGSDGAGVVYDGKTGTPIAVIPGGKMGQGGGHAGTIYACAWSPDSNTLLTAGADKSCKLWAVPNDLSVPPEADTQGSTLNALPKLAKMADHKFATEDKGDGSTKPGVGDMQVGCVFVGVTAVTLSLSGDLNVLTDHTDASPDTRTTVPGHPKPISAIAVDQTGQTYFACSLSALQGGDNLVLRWNDSIGCEGKVRGTRHTSAVCGAVCTQTGRLLTVGLDDTLRMASLGNNSYEADAVVKFKAQPRGVGCDSAGIEAAVVTNESLVLVHIGTCLTIAAEVVVDGEPFCVGVRPDGREVAVGCKDGKVRLFAVGSDSSSLTPGAVLERHRGEVTGCKYSPDGARLATCDGNREVLVWDPAAGTVAVDKMVFHRARVTCVGWSADGVRLATGSLDGQIIVWDTAKPPMEGHVRVDRAHVGGVTALEWVGADKIVSGGFDSCVKSWAV